jgi:hypothetical protein
VTNENPKKKAPKINEKEKRQEQRIWHKIDKEDFNEYLSQNRLQVTHKNHKSWVAKSSNKEPHSPLSLSPKEHAKIKEHSHH